MFSVRIFVLEKRRGASRPRRLAFRPSKMKVNFLEEENKENPLTTLFIYGNKRVRGDVEVRGKFMHLIRPRFFF